MDNEKNNPPADNGRNASAVRYVPAPRDLKGFPRAIKARPKTGFRGGRRRRWIDADGSILEWDYQHGRVEKYDARGKHLGEFDPDTAKLVGDADSDRRVRP